MSEFAVEPGNLIPSSHTLLKPDEIRDCFGLSDIPYIRSECHLRGFLFRNEAELF